MNHYKAIALVGGGFTIGVVTTIATRRFWWRRGCGSCQGCQVFMDSAYEERQKKERLAAICKNCKGCTRETCPAAKTCEGCCKEEEKEPCAECMKDFCDECQVGRTSEEIAKAEEPETTEGGFETTE